MYNQFDITYLQIVHSQKITHQDIKPENLLVDAQDRVRISDFGVSRMFQGDDDSVYGMAGVCFKILYLCL